MIRNSRNYKTWVEINAAAVRYNFAVLTKHLGKGVIPICVIKSNAYGHGLLEISPLLLNVRSPTSDIMSEVGLLTWFGVDSIEEALVLKKGGIKNPILILGYVPKPMLKEIVRNSFRVVLYDLNVLKQLTALAKKYHKKVFVHLKLETGAHRQGVMPEQITVFTRALKKAEPYVIVEGVYTHFADTENPASRYYKEQLAAFERALRIFKREGVCPMYTHTAASAAILMYPEAHFNMARFGIALYGMYPSSKVADKIKKRVVLQPALTWKTRIAQVKTIAAGKTIGYDRAYQAKSQMQIAVLPVGYWDGLDRRFSNNGEVLIGGKLAPIVGRVCMNMCMVDTTRIPHARAGDEVVLLGRQGKGMITAEELAGWIGTINYEITTRINPLIPRIVV